MMCKNYVFCPVVQNIPAYNFLATVASTCSTYHLGGVESLNFLVLVLTQNSLILRCVKVD